jgi:amino acid transporter
MLEIMQDLFDYLLAHYALYMVVTMSIIVSFTLVMVSLMKMPIKKLTDKIPNEKLRKLVNKVFILASFGISALCWFALNKISAEYFPFEIANIFLTGAMSVVLYAFGDGIINGSQAKKLIETTKEVVEDGETGKEEVGTAVNEFWQKIK